MKVEMRKIALQNKVTSSNYSSNGKQTAERQVLRSFRVLQSQFWTSSKCLLALEATTNNEEEKEVYTGCKR